MEVERHANPTFFSLSLSFSSVLEVGRHENPTFFYLFVALFLFMVVFKKGRIMSFQIVPRPPSLMSDVESVCFLVRICERSKGSWKKKKRVEVLSAAVVK